MIAVFIAGIAQFRSPQGAGRGNLTTVVAFAAALGLLVYRNTIGYPLVVVPAILSSAGCSAGLSPRASR